MSGTGWVVGDGEMGDGLRLRPAPDEDPQSVARPGAVGDATFLEAFLQIPQRLGILSSNCGGGGEGLFFPALCFCLVGGLNLLVDLSISCRHPHPQINL